MKKLIPIFISLLFAAASLFIYLISDDTYKVFDMVSPVEIYVDINRNLIFDEKEPVKIENIFFTDENKDYSDDEILSKLTFEEKFYLRHESKLLSEKLIKNRFVKIKDGEIYVKDKKYSDLLTDSGYFYTDDEESRKRLFDFVKSKNIENYVIYNEKTGKIHKLSCEKGRKSHKFSLVKRSEINEKFEECPFCFKKYQNKPCKKSKTKHNITRLRTNKEEQKYSSGNYKEVFESENIKIYFLDLNKTFKPSSKCDNKTCKDLKAQIDNAKNTIDFAIYGIDKQPEIAEALINAQKRGVKLRFVTDFDKTEENYYKDTLKLKEKIQNTITDEITDKKGRAYIMHDKFFIFDNKTVWTGSANITNTGLSGFNANIAVLVASKKLAEIYTQEFEQMYSGHFHGEKNKINKSYIKINPETEILPLFSPKDNILNDYIIKEINKAEKYIYIPVFFITYKELITPLINAHQRGVDVKIINDATNAHNKYSIHKTLREAGIKVKTENYAGKMHMKTVIIDDKISIIGSMNFTKSGTLRNDENMLIIKNRDIAIFLKNSFMYLWNKIPEKYEKFDPYPESKFSTGSCSDGVDNDFDGKIDSDDEGCFKK